MHRATLGTTTAEALAGQTWSHRPMDLRAISISEALRATAAPPPPTAMAAATCTTCACTEGERLLRQLQSLEAEQEEQRLLQRLRTAPRNGKNISARPHFGRNNSADKSRFEANLSVLLSAQRDSRQRARSPEIEEGMEWRNPDHM